MGLNPIMNRQSHGPSPLLGNQPEIALVAKDDLSIGDIGISHQPKRFALDPLERNPGKDKNEKTRENTLHDLSWFPYEIFSEV